MVLFRFGALQCPALGKFAWGHKHGREELSELRSVLEPRTASPKQYSARLRVMARTLLHAFHVMTPNTH